MIEAELFDKKKKEIEKNSHACRRALIVPRVRPECCTNIGYIGNSGLLPMKPT